MFLLTKKNFGISLTKNLENDSCKLKFNNKTTTSTTIKRNYFHTKVCSTFLADYNN